MFFAWHYEQFCALQNVELEKFKKERLSQELSGELFYVWCRRKRKQKIREAISRIIENLLFSSNA